MSSILYTQCVILDGISSGNNVYCWGQYPHLFNNYLDSKNYNFKKITPFNYGGCGLLSSAHGADEGKVRCFGNTTGNYKIDIESRELDGSVTWKTSEVTPRNFEDIKFKDIAARNNGLVCGIVDNAGTDPLGGKILCWGDIDTSNQESPPDYTSGTDTYIDIPAGDHHTCAVRNDNVPVCWRRLVSLHTENTSFPSGLNDILKIYSFYYRNIAVKTNGTLVYGGVAMFRTEDFTNGLIVDPNKDLQVALSSYGNFCVIPFETKNVKCFGLLNGQTDYWDRESSGEINPPESIQGKVLYINGTMYSFCAVLSETISNSDFIPYDVRCWGGGQDNLGY